MSEYGFVIQDLTQPVFDDAVRLPCYRIPMSKCKPKPSHRIPRTEAKQERTPFPSPDAISKQTYALTNPPLFFPVHLHYLVYFARRFVALPYVQLPQIPLRGNLRVKKLERFLFLL